MTFRVSACGVRRGGRGRHRVHCGEDKLVERGSSRDRINGIESFWGYA